MRHQFEWQIGKSKEGQWETIAEASTEPAWLQRITGRVPPRATRWAWRVLLVVVVACAAGWYTWIQLQSRRALEQAQFQIQSVVDLEVRTFEQLDRNRFLAVQDEQSPGWYAQQMRRYDFGHTPAWFGRTPAQVQAVDVQGEVARVEVIEEQGTMHRVRFYRWTELGWKHTTPITEPWETPVHIQYQDLDVRCHRSDLPHIAATLEHMTEVTKQVCAELACPPGRQLAVEFSLDRPLHQLPRVEGGTLILPSPWLSGIPVEGAQDEDYLIQLAYWTAFAMAYQATDPEPDQGPNPLHKALLEE